jgi:uncharacterized MAPEG superfamily protein
MYIVLWCLFVLVVIPYVLAGIGGYLRTRQFGRLDNNHPRIQAAQATGAAARAAAAQQNAWEALGVFTAAAFCAWVTEANAAYAANLAVVFVALRIVHAALYLADLATLRSLSFVGAQVCVIWLFLLGLV